MILPRRAAVISLRIMPILGIALLSLFSPKEALAQSLDVGNCVASTTSFNDTETVCASGTTAGSPDSDPALVCVLPSTGGVAADDVTGGCNAFSPASTFVDVPVWSPPTVPGSYIVVLFASDESVLQRNITIIDSSNTAPTATAQSVSTAEDVALPITLIGTDPESDPLTFAVVTGPSNGTLSGVAPNLTYTPNANYNGADSFTFRARDASLFSAAATISITVTAANDVPTATAQSVSTDEDVALAITLTGTDPESDPLTFVVVTGPSNGTLGGVAPNLTYTPDPNFNGADSFTFTASDAEFTSAAATISITVNAGNDVPTATTVSIDGITALGEVLTGLYTYGDVDGDLEGISTFRWLRDGVPIAATLSYTVLAADQSTTLVFEVTPIAATGANPGLAVPSLGVSITPNGVPTATAQSVSTAEDVALPITLTGTDPESDPLTFSVVTQPSNGTLSGVAPNLTYTPDLNFNGADSFTFTASDALLTSAAATISITVTAANDVPTATAQSVSTDEDVALAITLTGTDPESDPLTFAVVSGPSSGTLGGVAPNLTYTPDLNFNGADSFTFTARDALLTSAAATISITVGSNPPLSAKKRIASILAITLLLLSSPE
jgi:hypothetical protein